MLREHYHSRNNQTWVPKKAFTSEEEIKELLGTTADNSIYKCKFCNYLHVGRLKVS